MTLILIPFSSIDLSSLFCETGSLNEVAVWLDRLARKHRDLPYLLVSTLSAPHHPHPNYQAGIINARHYTQLSTWILRSRLRSLCSLHAGFPAPGCVSSKPHFTPET